MILDLQYFGGRGASSSGAGGSVFGAYNSILEGNADLQQLEKLANKMQIGKAVFTANGNSVKQQNATINDGSKKIDVTFYSGYDPNQTTGKLSRAIESKIEVRLWENGDIKGLRTLSKNASKSYKNAAKNYDEMLSKWKKITRQKTIEF